MKLPIKKEWLDKIKMGEKVFEYRDAHLTLVCEETGESIGFYVDGVQLIPKTFLPVEVRDSGCITDLYAIRFKLGDRCD